MTDGKLTSMSEQNSILDKIIESQEKQQAAQFNPSELIVNLLKNLSTKEGDILARRFGLLGRPKETLEQIGKYYDITRERIRQIETATIKKVRELRDFRRQVDSAEQHIIHLLEGYGGIMEQGHLIETVTENDRNEINQQAAKFVLEKLLSEKIDPIKADDDVLPGWKLPVLSLDTIRDSIRELTGIINETQQLLTTAELLDAFKKREFYKNNIDRIASLKLGATDEQLTEETEKAIHSYLRISRQIEKNILGEWGLRHWQTVMPKRMSDKVYLVLRQASKPLHFTEITDLINQAKFDTKVAYPATIHNELILDDRYVLVGRGIYALKEWGYKDGTVMDTIVDILIKANRPLSKDEIVEAVLKQRMVRKSTIYLALTNKDKIKKLPDGTFTVNQ